MNDYAKDIKEYMTEEEANEVMLQAAREELPNVPPHITVCMFLLRNSLHELAEALDAKPGCEGLVAKVEHSLIAAGTIHWSIVDAFNLIYSGGETIQ